ncbi:MULTISPECIES: DUF7134 domain-containing protein [Nocardiopsis]|uniref:DUF7134 domain-containing protein n=1 Tax=Nocardiopsis sinuspersici TaxID=501010 RepID=A0A1V3C425_9ACTN|nr:MULTISPECIES: hypothetical protein [Nocardiopsis]OOC55120.1 hypothetical protein NOSIN_15990 [Nocardiopsis sinuspersici]
MTSEHPRATRPSTADAVIAALVLLLELAATYATVNGDPFAPVDGWGATRSTDPAAFAAVVVGCGALYWRRSHPVPSLAVATAAYALFLLRDYELGLFLAPMVALYTVATLGRARIRAALAGAVALTASLLWVHARTAAVADPGTALLAWAAFGTVMAVFLAGPFTAGELVRCRRLLADRRVLAGGPA